MISCCHLCLEMCWKYLNWFTYGTFGALNPRLCWYLQIIEPYDEMPWLKSFLLLISLQSDQHHFHWTFKDVYTEMCSNLFAVSYRFNVGGGTEKGGNDTAALTVFIHSGPTRHPCYGEHAPKTVAAQRSCALGDAFFDAVSVKRLWRRITNSSWVTIYCAHFVVPRSLQTSNGTGCRKKNTGGGMDNKISLLTTIHHNRSVNRQHQFTFVYIAEHALHE